MWFCIKSVYKNGDWTYIYSLQKEFPTIVTNIEIHEIKNPEVDHGFILFHFGYNECDQIQFFSHRDDALQHFESKVQIQQCKIKKENYSFERYEVLDDLLVKMSTLYIYVNTDKFYAGDRWIIQELDIK
jgi:hypothetical protein